MDHILRNAKRAIILGVGGGGDIVGAIPTLRFLEHWGIHSVLGGLAWERFIYDPVPGTRTLDDVVNVKPLGQSVWIANAATQTVDGLRFSESVVAEFYGTDTILIDLTQGVPGIVEGLRAAMKYYNADLLVGIDVGGDSLASGVEPGLQSPLADGMMLAAIYHLLQEFTCLWGVVGYGSDGELKPHEIDKAISDVARHGGLLGAWGITPMVTDEVMKVLENVYTDASAVVIESARGGYGTKHIRQGTQTVSLSPVCCVTFYLSPKVLYEQVAVVARELSEATSIEYANQILLGMGLPSEYEFEKQMFRQGIKGYTS